MLEHAETGSGSIFKQQVRLITDFQEMINNAYYEKNQFSAPLERIDRFAAVIFAHFQKRSGARILDIGCGSGEQVFKLGRDLDESELYGVDISAPNISSASQQAKDPDSRNAYNFILRDYLYFDDPAGFDLIISYSTLHLIPVATSALLEKIARDLTPGGRLIITIPKKCLYNYFLILVRQVFRATRCRLTDRLIFTFGKWISGVKFDEDQLRERIIYMYMIPHLLDGGLFRSLARDKGLHTIAVMPELHASIAQLKHNCIIMEKK